MGAGASLLSVRGVLEEGPRLRRRILSVLLVAGSIVHSTAFFDPYNVPKLTLLAVAVIAVLAIRLIELLQGARPPGAGTLWVPVVALVAPLAIAWAFTPYKQWALLGTFGRFQGLVPYLLFALLAAVIADAFTGRLRELCWALALGTGIVGLYGVLQTLGLDIVGVADDDVARASLGNPNFFGGFLAIGLPITIHLALHESDDLRRAQAWALVGATAAGIVVSQSEGAWGAAAGGVAIYGGWWLSLRGGRWWRWAGAGAALLMALLMVGIVLASIALPGDDRIPLTIQDRGRFWEQGVSMAADSPLVGRGPNAFAVEAPQHRPARDLTQAAATDIADDPHNVMLQLAANAGLPGAIGFLALLAWVLVVARRYLDQPFVAALAAGAVAYFLQSLVSIDEVGLRLWFWACVGGLGATVLQHAVAEEPTQAPRKARGTRRKQAAADTPLQRVPLVIATGLLGVVGMTAAVLTIAVPDVFAKQGVDAFNDIDPFTGRDRLQSAIALREDYEYRQMLGFQSGQAAADGGARAGQTFADTRDDAYGYLDNFPNVGALRDHASLLLKWAVVEEEDAQIAADLYIRATTLDPVNPLIARETIDVLVTLERWDDLEAACRRFLSVGEERAEAWGGLALALEEQGDSDEAATAARRALDIEPAQPLALRALGLEEGEEGQSSSDE